MSLRFATFFFWCLASSVVLSCEVWMNGIGTVTPSGDVVEPVGATIKIDCTLFKNRSEAAAGNSRSLMWTKNGNEVPRDYVQIVDNVTIRLMISDTLMKDSGMYSCYLNRSTGRRIVCQNNVEIGYPPLDVLDFSCISPNWQYLLCGFTRPENKITTAYTVTFIRNSVKWDITPKRTKKGYTWNITIDTSPMYQESLKTYVFKLTAVNKLGTKSWIYQIDLHSRILPNKPELVGVFDENSTSINITWARPQELKSLEEEMRYRLFYRSQWDKPDFWNMKIDLNTTSILIDVLPYTEYSFMIQCKVRTATDEKLWSPNTNFTHRSLADIPGKAPLLVSGSFEDKKKINSRSVTIYWQTIPPYKRNGMNFSYAAQVVLADNVEKNIIFPNEMKENYAKFERLELETVYDFEVYSVNEVGRSEESSRLIIEKESTIPGEPESFTSIYFDHGTYELSWTVSSEAKEISNFTLFWCNNIKPHPFRCQGNLSWVYVGPEVRVHNITLQDERMNYHFAITANTKSATSGMVWATCIVPYNGTLNRMKKITLTSIGKYVLKVSWKLDCSERIGIVTGFNIYYCKILTNDTTGSCLDNQTKQHVEGSQADHYIIEDLRPFTFYKVTVSVVTRAGEGEHSNPLSERTNESAPPCAAEAVNVVDKTHDTVTLAWKAPFPPYGNIVRYKVFVEDTPFVVNALPDQTKFSTTLRNLEGYKNYTITFSACIADGTCSPKSNPTLISTDIGAPSGMSRPQIVNINSTLLMLSFDDPATPNGPIDFYNLRTTWQSEDGANHTKDKLNITGKETVLDNPCMDPGMQKSTLFFSVQAVNVRNETLLEGPFSDPISYDCSVEPVAQIIIIAVASTFGIIVLVLFFIYGYRRFKTKCQEIKNIKIHLPKGLEPDNLKSPGFQSLQTGIRRNKAKKDAEELLNQSNCKLQDNFRLRNTSGDTRISSSSIDELLQRNGDVRTEGNGDNGSALGSVSSTQTTRSNLSSDSGNDVDSLPPTTPDTVFTEHPINGLKTLHEMEAGELDGLQIKPVCTDDVAPDSYSKFASYLGSNTPAQLNNGYLPTTAPVPDNSAYVLPNPPPSMPYSQVGLAAGFNYINYPSGRRQGVPETVGPAVRLVRSHCRPRSHPAGRPSVLFIECLG